jgi:hypothetical protein
MRVAVADATQAIALVTEAAETDLPGIIADVRAAVDRATAVIDTVGTDLTEASGGVADVVARADTTLAQVTRPSPMPTKRWARSTARWRPGSARSSPPKAR